MPKIFGVEIDSIMFYLLYLILLAVVILEHNVIDIIYFFTLTIYLIRLFIIKRKAGDVGRHHVRGKLHPLKVTADGFCQRFGQSGFPGTRHVFQQDMPAAQKGQNNLADQFFLAKNDAGQVFTKGTGGLLQLWDIHIIASKTKFSFIIQNFCEKKKNNWCML